MKRENQRSKWTAVCKRLFAFCFLASLAMAMRLYYVEYREAQKARELAQIYQEGSPAGQAQSADDAETDTEEETSMWPSAAYQALSAINGDYLGWLRVSGTVIDLPVVLGTDNEYYLKHDFYGAEDSYGTLFADCSMQRGASGNLLIYGHHMRNGSMFAALTDFCGEEFFQAHSVITMERADGIHTYEIFAVTVIPGDEEAEDYLPVRDWVGEQEWPDQLEILQTLRERTIWWRNLAFTRTENLLFLLTCDYTRENGRLLLCAREV
jgi:sortase B